MNPIGGTSQTQSQNPFAPYNAYRDCSQGICTIYCPQWCYLIFPPPPPFALDDDASHGSDFSPLIIALVGALASAFILVAYYVVVSKYCRRGRSRGSSRVSLEFNENRSEANQEASCEATSAGLDEAVIRSISVYKYKKGEGLCEGTDCSVCLSEFQENETLRLLPKCSHAFHVTCIDTWLKSHSSCPLCRASIASNNGPPNPVPDQIHENSQAAALEYHRRNDHVLVIGDMGDGSGQDRVLVVAEDGSKTEIVQEREGIQIGQETANTNSSPVGSSIYQDQVCVADILSITEEEEASRLQPPNGFGSNT